MSSDSDDESCGPPPARHDTGTFVRPGQEGLEMEKSVTSAGTLSPTSHSSFRWDRAQSFRLYAVNSRSLLRRNTSFGLGERNNSGSNLLSTQSSQFDFTFSSSTPNSTVVVGDDPKSIVKSCYDTLKAYILTSGHLTSGAGSESTLPSNLKKGPPIGSGGYATVFCGINTSSGELVAIKEIEITGCRGTNPQAFASVEDEFALLRKLRHKHVIQYLLFEYSISQQLCRIVMEFCAGGSSLEMLQKFGTLPESLLKHIAAQVFSALAFIHKEGIIHRDIKPANILMHANGQVKLADFGCGKRINELSETTSHVLGTPVYMAPEYIKGKIHRKSDVWAVGCTLLELATGKAPWHHTRLKDNLALMFHISTTYEGPQIPYADISNDMCDFLAKCFDRNVDSRPEASELLEHPWLTTRTAEDEEGLVAIEEIGADQFSVLCEQLCVPLEQQQHTQLEIGVTSPVETPGSDKQLLSPNRKESQQHLSDGVLQVSNKAAGGGGLGASMIGGSFLSSAGSEEETTPAEEPLTLPEEPEENNKLPEGPVHVEVPVEVGGGRKVKLDLEVQPEDVSVRMLNRRKSYVVNFTDGIRGQIQQALQAEADNILAQSEVLSSPSSTPMSSALITEPTGW